MAEGKVAKNTALLVAAFVGQKILSFVYFTLAARAVGVEGAGKYVIATSFTTIFSIFVDLGLANVLVREVAKFPQKAETLLANVLGIKAVLAALSVVGVWIGAMLLGYPPDVRLMIAIASGVMVLDSIHLVFYGVMRGFQNLRYESIGVITGQVVTILTGSLFFFVLHLPLPFLIVALLCGSAWNVLWSWMMLRKHFPVRIRLAYDGAIVSYFRTVTVPFALAGIFSRVYSYIDSIMLSKLATAAEVGIYGVAYKLAFAFQFLPMSFAAAVYPAMSDYYVNDRQKLGRIFDESMKYLMFMVVPLAFGIAVLARPIIAAVYGRAFVGAVVPLQILIFSLIFAFLYWPAGSLLNACDRQGSNTIIMGITMVANAALNAVLIPLYGAVGAACAALAGNFILWALAMRYVRAVTPYEYKPLIIGALQCLFAGSFMALTLAMLRPYAHFLLLIPLGVVEYGVVLVLSGGVTVTELKDILAVFLRRGGKKFSDIVA
ncbi:MAG TPA: flippase [Candidatus Eisenbacteria bacterium]|nr:flippase [Candidatus Eisenbacteria bacterium]